MLDVLLRASVLAWIGSIVYPIVRYLKPLPVAGVGGPIALSPEQAATLDVHHYAIVRSGPRRVIVFLDPRGELRALNAICTHEGCTVQYRAGEGDIWCACHNGRFAPDGTVIAGPPPRALEPYRVKRDDAGNVVVSGANA